MVLDTVASSEIASVAFIYNLFRNINGCHKYF